ncbi:SIS domain-containing protein [Sporosalibacterium faouarense]|uniref:SIS domain-containing protein n=1 Tax=Sporosalibacterium faouarense TaxID=516123 RepID=UPI00141C8702|nr:SIS domain-containing protein [Sporosalibacterium faouarense]MTI47123.1 SIS domain-containing protein [Bacillota bacterium]
MLFEFYDKVEDLLNEIKDTQSSTIQLIADKVATIIDRGGILYTFGTGHSHLLAEEIYARAGGLFQVKAILEPELMLHQIHGKSTLIERLSGYADIILEINEVRKGDAIIIISNSGRNSVPIELAIKAKEKGLLVIALTNLKHSKSVDSRNKSGKRLFEVADFVLDNCGVPGDAILKVKNKHFKIAPTSTIAGAVILQGLVAGIVDKIHGEGKEVPVMVSANLDNSDQYNEKQLEKLLEKHPELFKILR